MEFVTSGPLHAISATFLLCVVLWISYLTGLALLGRIGFGPDMFARIEERLFSTGLGMLVVSAGVFFLGIAGKLSVLPVAAFLMTLLLVSFISLKRRNDRDWGIGEVMDYVSKNRLFCISALAVFALSWVQAVSPPIGNDALAYHLYHAKEFILRHRIQYLTYERESLWPYFTETFFMIGLLLEGTILPQLFHWAFYVMTAALVYSFGRRFYDEKIARLAMVIFIFTPAAFAQAGHAYVDLALAFFVFASLYAFLLYDLHENDRLLVLSGLFAGGAAAVKYLGLGSFFVLAALTAVRTRLKIKPMLFFLLSVFAASGFWYIHSWMCIGNPVYPFFSGFFGSGYQFDIAENVGMGKDLPAFLMLAWNMTMHPRSFGGEMIGPLFLMFVPLLLLNLKHVRRPMIYMSFFGFFYLAFLFTQSQHLRFYISTAPFLAVGSAVALYRFRRAGDLPWKTAMSAACLVFLMHTAIFIYRTRVFFPAAIGAVSPGEYLKKYERSYEGFLYFKDNLKPNEKFFNSAEVRCFYNSSGDRMLYDSMPFRIDLKKKGVTIEQYLDREKFDYVWLLDDNSPDVRRWVEAHPYKKAYSYELTEKPHTFHYDIYKLESGK